MHQDRSPSSALRRLHAAEERAGIRREDRDCVLAAVLAALAARMSPAQWQETCGCLPWDVRSLADTLPTGAARPRGDLSSQVAAQTGLPRAVAIVAARTVLMELTRVLAPATLPPRLTVGVPGL
jgi:hypothetical protein